MEDEIRLEDLEEAQQKLEQNLREEILRKEVSNSKFQAHFDVVNERLDELINIADSIRLHLLNINNINKNLGNKDVQVELKEEIEDLVDGLVDSNENVDENIKDYDDKVESDFAEVEEIGVVNKSAQCIHVTDVMNESTEFELKKLVPSLNLHNEIILNFGVNELLFELPGWRAPTKDGIGGSFLGNYLKCGTNWCEAPMRKDGIGVSFLDNDLKCETSCKFSLDCLQSYVLDSLNCARKFGLFAKDRSKIVGKYVGSNWSEFLKSHWDRIALATYGDFKKDVSGRMIREDYETFAEQGETDLVDRETWSEVDYVVEFIQFDIYKHAFAVMETEENGIGKAVKEDFSLEAANGRCDVPLLTIESISVVHAIALHTLLFNNDFDDKIWNQFVLVFMKKHKQDVSCNLRAPRIWWINCERAKITLSLTDQSTIDIDSFYEGFDFYPTLASARLEGLNWDLFWEGLELVGIILIYRDITFGTVDFRKLSLLVKDTKGMGRKMEKYANFIASLYTELEVMKELESAIKKFQQHQHEECRNVLEQKLTWQLHDVKHLKDVSLWNQIYGMVIELLASTLRTTFALLCVMFGNVCSRYASFARPQVGFLQDLNAKRLDFLQNSGSHKVLADATQPRQVQNEMVGKINPSLRAKFGVPKNEEALFSAEDYISLGCMRRVENWNPKLFEYLEAHTSNFWKGEPYPVSWHGYWKFCCVYSTTFLFGVLDAATKMCVNGEKLCHPKINPCGQGSSQTGGIVMVEEGTNVGSVGKKKQWELKVVANLGKKKNAVDGLKYIRRKFSYSDPRGRGSYQPGGIVMDGGGLKEHGGIGRKERKDRMSRFGAENVDSCEEEEIGLGLVKLLIWAKAIVVGLFSILAEARLCYFD